jgi:phage FluMu gp28-like protein
MNGILLPYQKRWNDDPATVKFWEKSRRIGASFGDSADSALVASLAKKDGGMSTYYISYNKDMTRQYVADTARWAKVFNLVASEVEEFVLLDEDKEITVYQVTFPATGFVVQGLSSNPSNLRSKQGRIRIDEAAFVDNLAEILKAALAMVIWGGNIGVISTHDGDDNEFNQCIQDIRAGKLDYSIHRTTFDDALAEGLYKVICKAKGIEWSKEAEAEWREKVIADYGDGAEEELFCVPSKSGGAYLLRNAIESCMSADIPVMRWSPPASDFVDWHEGTRFREMRDWCEGELKPLLDNLTLPDRPSWGGEDFGRDVDLTCIWPLQEAADLTMHTPFITELRDCPFQQQEQVLFYIFDRLPLFSGAALDKGGNGSFLAERARQQYGPDIIDQVSFSSNWCLENWPATKAHIQDRTATLPLDAEVLDDFRAVKVVKGVPKIPEKRSTGKDGGKRHGDSAVSFALAVYASRRFEANAGGNLDNIVTSGPGGASRILRGF